MNVDLTGSSTIQEITAADQLEAVLQVQKAKPQLKLGAALLQENIITVKQLNVALQKQTQDRNVPLGKILIGMGAVTDEIIRRVLTKKFGIPTMNLRRFHVDSQAIRALPPALAHKHRAVPLYRIDSRMVIAMEDPLARESLQDLELCLQLKIDPVLASREEIDFLVQRFYGISHEHHDDASTHRELNDRSSIHHDISAASEAAAIEKINQLVKRAKEQNALEIHIESAQNNTSSKVRLRRDGMMFADSEIASDLRDALIWEIKMMGGVNVSEKYQAQQGKIRLESASEPPFNLQVTTIPTIGGLEDIVIRIIASPEIVTIDHLGLSLSSLDKLKQVIHKSEGMVIVCGPASSGKTTTLHSLLGYLNSPSRKIWAIEDRIEIKHEEIRQIQIHPKSGWTFSAVIENIANPSSDLIMVGEIRDQATAKSTTEISLTGHLVVSAMRTPNAIESVARLLDYGVDSFNLSDALSAILNQRLVKILCPDCKKPHLASNDDLEILAQQYCSQTTFKPAEIVARWQREYSSDNKNITLYFAAGCDKCNHTGHKGHMGIYELLIISSAIRQKIISRTNLQEIAAIAIAEGMQTIKQDGIEKVLQGYIDWEQLQVI